MSNDDDLFMDPCVGGTIEYSWVGVEFCIDFGSRASGICWKKGYGRMSGVKDDSKFLI